MIDTTYISETSPSSSSSSSSSSRLSSAEKERWFGVGGGAVAIGDISNCVSIVLNVAVTVAVLFNFPSYDTFDDSWRQNGQCYTTHQLMSGISGRTAETNTTTTTTTTTTNDNSNDGTVLLPFTIEIETSVLCCLFLCGSATAVLVRWYYATKGTKSAASSTQSSSSLLNEQLQQRLPKLAEANISHGLGHYFIHQIGGSIPHVRPWSLRPADIGYTLVLVGFFPLTLRSVMPRLPMSVAVVVGLAIVIFQGAIDIEPYLQFSFAQGVILLVQSVDLLTMPMKDKVANPLTYLATALYYIPVFPMLWLETTHCTDWVAAVGGHAIYDFYLSAASLAMAFVMPHFEPASSAASVSTATTGEETKKEKTA